MALLTACPDLVPEAWLSPSIHHPDDLWTKFDLESDRTLVLPNPSPNGGNESLAAFLDMGGGGGGGGGGCIGLPPTGALPTPPHSPPTEHDLDDLVASIPEILESPSASPPSAISEILSDLEGMETSATPSPPRMEGPWCVDWWGGGLITPHLEAPIKRDIMWGGGGGGTGTTSSTNTTVTTTAASPSSGSLTPLGEVKKERQDSESSTEAAYKVINADDFSDDSDSDDNLPDTPSCTDSDCDADDPSWPPPPHLHNANITTIAVKGHHHLASPSVSSEHNYCGRVPEAHHHSHHHSHHLHHHHQHTTGTITPSDTEDEVDVVSCSEPNDITTTTPASLTTTTSRLHLPPPPPTPTNTTNPPSSTTTTTTTTSSKEVKRQLQLAIQEAVRNRQNRTNNTSRSSSGGDGNNNTTTSTTTTECLGGDVTATTTTTTTRLVSVKIKTQGKPAAYTKRMRDYHSEVVKSTKHRRRNKGENDEGRRSVHNSLERQRRVDLRNAFEYLRQLVPDTMILEKAPKVQILKKAALHCKNLQQTEQRLLREKEKLKRQLEDLKMRHGLCS